MSPEQLRRDRKDARNDVYALGAMLYLLLAGRAYLDFILASSPEADAENVRLIKNTVPLPLEKARDGQPIPEALRQVVMRALAKTAAERFHTAGEMGDALRAAERGGGAGRPDNGGQVKPPPSNDRTRVIPSEKDKADDLTRTRLLPDSDRTTTRIWRRPASQVNPWLLVLAAFIAALIGRALEPTALTWLFGLGIGPLWLVLALVGGAFMALPLWLSDDRQPARGRWALAGWLALLDVLMIIAAIRLVQEAALARGAEAGALTGGEWLFLLFPFLALAGLLIWALVAAGGAGRSASPALRSGLWTVAAGGLSGFCGSVLSALLPGETIWLAASLQMLVFIVSAGLLLRLSVGDWLVLAALTLAGALVLPILAVLAGAEAETLALYGWLGAISTAIGYATGVALMERTT
jgi:hypothetical protein